MIFEYYLIGIFLLKVNIGVFGKEFIMLEFVKGFFIILIWDVIFLI